MNPRPAAALAALAVLAWSAGARAETHRLAIVVGNNQGDAALTPLRYAEADAEKLARALREVGGVEDEDLFLLQGRTELELEQAFARAQGRIASYHRTPDTHAVLVFYFSGHSDGEALMLGAERLPLAQLKQLLASSGAEVRVTVVDSCHSGQAVLAKGGKPAPAFTLRLADDLATTGEATVASSAADEVALESRELQGSYFTSAFVSGLRGAADVSGDGQVTLAEAYRYAYDKTVAATGVTLEGAQHPTYAFKLSGQGELVLANVNRASAALVLPEGAERSVITDAARDQVVAEAGRGSGRMLALAPGEYAVRALYQGHAYAGKVELAHGEVKRVRWDDLAPEGAMVVAVKGPTESGSAPAAEAAQAAPVAPAPAFVPTAVLTVGAGVQRGVTLPGLGQLRLGLEFTELEGFQLVGAVAGSTSDGQNEAAFQGRLGYQLHFRPSRWLVLGLGAEAGAGMLWQAFYGQTASTAFLASVGPRGSLRLRLGQHAGMVLDAGVPVTHLSTDTSSNWIVLPEATLGVAFEL